MGIKRVVIKNFRSIRDLDFEPKSLCTLVGENNSGKSTILRAINLVLGEQWPTERSFEESDFHNGNTKDPIVIEVYFDTPLSDPRVSGFRLTCSSYKRASQNKVAGELRIEFICIGPQGGKVPAQQYRPGGPSPPPLRVNNVLRGEVPMLYVDVLREYARHGPSSRWSTLRRIIDQINASFSNDTSQVAVPTAHGIRQMSRSDAYKYHSDKAFEVLRTTELQKLETALERNALEQMGLQPSSGSVSLGFAGYDPANAFRNLELIVNQFGIESRAQEVGAGLQSAIVVAIFRTYEQLRRTGAIFAIEEPEAFLHPQKARYFASILEGISEGGQSSAYCYSLPLLCKAAYPGDNMSCASNQ